ncbi:MAG: hybrid sensor histidine kinase/response regulator [Bacteroidetes bacterium]|jgi:two-component system, sensor histidine kinase and response regulator|nr:hybrid sensor histidine kinase/response regulator [Bacteroidota bacterium]MBT4400365.1 hybrid sensor histidine kinase/response regulator [Bacteroidota bacterium]MBT7091985.1 hybrid sensor histidine kinase/response regulator [Bacteroidota bacterium]MBT7462702.1 hybrid sensor histidine kinase/response regulator [Bacteroidota bacterium]
MESKKYKILVVDDNTNNIEFLANLLSENGYDVDFSLNGSDALKLVEFEDFDLILLDIMMPEMDGFEVCQRIKDDPDKNEIPIIFLTAKTDIESIEKAFDLGGLDYVSKPFSTNELLARVKTHVELKEGKDKLKQVNNWLEEKVDERTAELNIANKKLLQLDSAKAQFLQIISHEIRTPLNAIIGMATLITDTGLTEESETYIELLNKSTTRLEEFSIKALDISQLNTYDKELIKPTKVSVKQIILNAIADIDAFIESKKVKILQTIDTDNEIINVDKNYFHKCIVSILHNAIKYSPNNGLVSVIVSNQDKDLIIEIRDAGVGFSNEFIINEIGPFESEDHMDKNPGLDLFLSNLIVKAHGGSIENGNNKDKGAFVRIIMPID